MKKFFLVLITLSILPFSMLRSDDGLFKVASVAVVLGLGIGIYQWHNAQKEQSIDTLKTTNTQSDNKKPEDYINGNNTPLYVSVDKDNPHIKAALEELDRLNEKKKETPSNPSTILEKPTQPSSDTLKQPITSKSPEIIVQKDPSFMEKLLSYEADYKELHDDNRDCFEN